MTIMNHNENMEAAIISIVLAHYPQVQGIYLFGSHAAGASWPDSDMDIALLLPHEQAKTEQKLAAGKCRFALEDAMQKTVDLLNARQASTVFQKEMISGKLIFCGNRNAVDEFEMLTLSYYQQLNWERSEILDDFYKTGRAYAV